MRYFKLSDGRTVTCRDAQAVSTLIKWGRENKVGLSEVYWYKTPDGKDWTVDAWAKNNGALDNPKLKGAMDMGAKEAHDHPFVRGDQATIQARKPGEAGLTPSHEKTFIEKAWDVVKHPLLAGIRTALGPVGSVVDLYAGAAKLVSGNDKNKANPIYQDPEPPRWVQEPLNRRNEAVTNLENLSVSRPPAEAPELESAWKQQYDSTLAEAEKQEEIYLFRATGLTEAQREYKEETATWAKKYPLLATLSQLPTGFEALYKAPANVMAAGGAIDTGKGWWYAKRQGLAEGLAEAGKGWSDWGSALYSFGLTMPSYVATLSIALSGGATAPVAGPLIIAAASARELSSMSDNLRDSYFNDGVLSTNELWAGATNAFIEEGIETIGLNLQAGTFANAYKLGGTAGMQKAIATQLGKKAMPGLAQGGLTFMTMYGEELGEEILTNVGQMVVNNVMLGTPLPTREELQQQFRDTAVQTLYGTILQGGVSVGYTVMQSQSQMRKLTALSDETLSWSSPKMALDAINQLKAFDIEGAKATAMKAQETLIKDDAAMDDKAKKVVAQAIGNVLDASLKYDMQTAEGVYVEQKAVQKTLDRLEAEQKQLEQGKPSPERDQRLFDIGEQIEELQRESIRIDGLITENAQQKEIYNLLVEGSQAEQKARKAWDKAVDKLVKTKEYKEATPEQQRQMMKDAVLSDKKSAKLQEKADQKYRDADLYKLRQTPAYKQAAPEVQAQMEEAELQRQQEARDADIKAAEQRAISEQQEAEKASQTQPTEATEDNEVVPDIIDQLEAKKAAIRQERQDINKELNEYRKLMDQQGGWLPSVTPEQKKAYHEVKQRQKEVNRKLNEVGIEIRKEKAARKKAEREAQKPKKKVDKKDTKKDTAESEDKDGQKDKERTPGSQRQDTKSDEQQRDDRGESAGTGQADRQGGQDEGGEAGAEEKPKQRKTYVKTKSGGKTRVFEATRIEGEWIYYTNERGTESRTKRNPSTQTTNDPFVYRKWKTEHANRSRGAQKAAQKREKHISISQKSLNTMPNLAALQGRVFPPGEAKDFKDVFIPGYGPLCRESKNDQEWTFDTIYENSIPTPEGFKAEQEADSTPIIEAAEKELDAWVSEKETTDAGYWEDAQRAAEEIAYYEKELEKAETEEERRHIEKILHDLDGRVFDDYTEAEQEELEKAESDGVELNEDGYPASWDFETEAAPVTQPASQKDDYSGMILPSKHGVKAEKQPNGMYKLYFIGTLNEVFPGEEFHSPQLARSFLEVQRIKQREQGRSLDWDFDTRTKSEALRETLPTIPDKTADDALLGMVKSHILSITRKDRTTTVNFRDGRQLVINHITQEAMLTEAGRTGVKFAGRTQGEKGKNVYKAIVDLVDGLNQGNRTLFHESFHVVWKLFLNSEQISYINQYYRAKANKGELVRKYVVTRQGTEMALYWTKEQFNALNRERQAEALEEGAAYGFEHWLGSRTDTAPTTMIGKLWQRLADAIRHALVKLNLASQNAKLTDIFHAIASDKLTGQGEQGAETRNMVANAYHGSGAFFDRFDVQFVGTGEGAQAFGWGIYVTERDGVARDYAEKLGKSGRGLTIDGAYMQDLTTEEIKELINWDTSSIEDDELRDRTESVFISNIEREAHNAFSRYGINNMQLRNYMNIGLSYAKSALKRYDAYYDNEDIINKLADSLKNILASGLETGLIKYDINRGRNIYTVDVWADRTEDVLEWYGKPTQEQINKIKAEAAKEGKNIGFTKVPVDFQYVGDAFGLITDQLGGADEFRDGDLIYSFDFPYGGTRINVNTGKQINITEEAFAKAFNRLVDKQKLDIANGTGEAIYHKLSRHFGSDKAASKFLLRAGIDGIKYPVNALSGGKGEKGYNYVVFDADQIQIKDHTRYKPVPTAAEVAEAERQYAEVEAKYKGTAQWLKAPNGKPTNLNERQWVQVRTQAFKDWFGDWENDPAKYRALLDNNGEPLQLYHGGTVDNIFDTTGKTSVGAFFTPSREGAEYYAYNAGEKVGEYFISPGKILNLTNENVLREWWNKQDGDSWFGISIDDVVGLLDSGSLYQDDMGRTQNAILDQARKDGYDTVIFQDATSGQVENSYVKFAPNQIKSATANVGTFDQGNPDIRYRKLTERERAMWDDVWNEIMGRPQKLRAETKPRVQTEPPERGQERKTEPPRPQPTRPSQSNPPTDAEIDVLSERIGKDLGIAPAQVKEKLGRQMMAAWREAQGDVSRLMESAAIRNFEEWVENNKPEGTDKKDLVWHWEEMLEYAAKVGLSREQIAQMVKSDRFDATAIGINLFQRMNYIGKLLVETEATLSDRNWGTPAEREQMEAQYGILQAQFDELQAAYAMQGSEAGTVLWTRRQNKAQYLENLTRAAQALESKINRGAVELGEMRQELDGLERVISDLEKSFEMLLRVMDGKRYKDITEMNDAELEAERQKQAERLNDLRNQAEHLKYAIEQKVAAMQADKGRQEETQTQIRKIRKTGRKAKVIEIKERKPDVHDWIRAAWYNSVLAGVPTHMINMSANVVNSFLEDVATLFTQGGRVAGAQFAEKVRALFSNYEQLDPKTGEKIKTGAFAKAKEEFTNPQEFSKKNEVMLKGNKFFMGIQFSTKFLGAEDMLAFFPNERGMLKSLAFDESKRTGRSVADLMENPTADMLRQAYYEAKRNTFNQNPEQYVGVLIDTINKFYGALDQSGGGGKAIGNLIRFNVLPFTRVLGNVLNATIDYTPLGMIRYFAYKSDNPNSLLNRQRKDQNGRPLWLDENGDPMVSPFRMRDARRQAARVALGTILGSLLYFLAMSADDDDDDKWFISGAGPQNYKKYKQLMAAGWRPYSIHIGNAIISYKEWPVSGAFAVVGNLHDIQKYDGKTRPEDWLDKTIYATMGVASSFLDRSFASNAISTATAFDRNDPKWVKRSLTSTTSSTIIPYNNMLRFIENTYNRNLYTPETIAQQAWASVPLVPKKGLPRRVNVFGMYERKDPATARLAMTDNVGLVVPDTQNTRKIFRTVRKNNLFLSETTKRELRVDPYVGKRGIPEEDKQHIWLQGKDHENFRVMRGTEYVRLLNESENYNLIMKYDKDKDKDEMAALLTSLGRKATAYATEETLKAYQRGELKHKYKTYNKSKEEE